MGRACSMHGDKRNTYKILVGKLDGMRRLGRPRPRWKDNIKTDLREMMVCMDRIDLTQDSNKWRALVNTVMNLRVP
jgi:hypothetical protein